MRPVRAQVLTKVDMLIECLPWFLSPERFSKRVIKGTIKDEFSTEHLVLVKLKCRLLDDTGKPLSTVFSDVLGKEVMEGKPFFIPQEYIRPVDGGSKIDGVLCCHHQHVPCGSTWAGRRGSEGTRPLHLCWGFGGS